MNYYQKYLKYKKKYFDLANGGSDGNLQDTNQRRKFCDDYHLSSYEYGRNVYPIRCTDGGSDHYVLHKEIDNTIYISFNIQKPHKDSTKEVNEHNERYRMNIMISELNNLISSLNRNGNKKIIINVQECVKSNYDILKNELICSGKKFSFTKLFACTITIAYLRHDLDKDYVGLDNNWLYGYEKDYITSKSQVGINSDGNTENASCLCTFVYDPQIREQEPLEIDAKRALMSSHIWKDKIKGINAGTHEFITKAIYIPEYDIFNVHFTKNNNEYIEKGSFKDFIQRFKNSSLFTIDHETDSVFYSKFGIQQNQDEYNIVDDLLANYNGELAKNLRTRLHQIPAYYYINMKLDSIYNSDPNIANQKESYILGDFNNDSKLKSMTDNNYEFIDMTHSNYGFTDYRHRPDTMYNFKEKDQLNNYLDHMVKITPDNIIEQRERERKEKEEREIERKEKEEREREREREIERERIEKEEEKYAQWLADADIKEEKRLNSFYKKNPKEDKKLPRRR